MNISPCSTPVLGLSLGCLVASALALMAPVALGQTRYSLSNPSQYSEARPGSIGSMKENGAPSCVHLLIALRSFPSTNPIALEHAQAVQELCGNGASLKDTHAAVEEYDLYREQIPSAPPSSLLPQVLGANAAQGLGSGYSPYSSWAPAQPSNPYAPYPPTYPNGFGNATVYTPPSSDYRSGIDQILHPR